ncbi:hypothetical protein FA13DRAFT_1755239 [Coprinellus micaceus]|uniref:Uncharacterized protein n=1 Tax=Coprinellus micaceus TaxID=71717 RepID=A0A4Y7T903_COPMI|nr:hypothetical protein FA13DRAFT_1755239 [Coprinellus micaceus]
MNDIQLRPSLDMKLPCSADLDERPSRRTKLESRDAPDSHSSSTDHPRMHRGSLDHRRKPDTPNGSKPASRIPSRPLSSTTSNTGSTATPSTPKASKRPASGLPTPKATPTQQQPQPRENATPSSSSPPTTPKSSVTKKTLHNLFGIPQALRRASRSRSQSRPNSPQPSLKSVKDAPPVPGSAWYDDDKTPKARQPIPSPLTARNPSPTRKPKSRASDPPTSLKLPKLFSAAISGASSLQPRPSSTAAGTGTSVSAPLKRPSSPPSTASGIPNGKSLLPSKVKDSPPPSAMKPVSKVPSAPSRHASKGASMDASYRYRGGNMSIVEEESSIRTSIRTSIDMNFKPAAPASLKGKAREDTPTPTSTASHLRPALKMNAAVRSTKHGSFDFERPGWGTTMIQRTGSNGTAISNLSKESTYTAATAPPAMASGEHRHREKDTRESTFSGPGLAGVGTLQRDMSLKRAKDSEEQIRARERAQRLHDHIHRDKLPPLPTANGHSNGHVRHGGSDLSDHNAHSTSTNGTARTGKDSSAGKGGSGSGISRLIGTAQHGLFSWEPPVPSPTRSTTSHCAPGDNGGSSRGGSTDRSATREDSKLKYSGLRGDRPAVPVPTSSIPQRPGPRGRSLDLGIGLAWAPSKLKEEALMPSSTLFARSASGSTTGRSVSSSNGGMHEFGASNGHGHGSRSRRIHIQDGVENPEADRTRMGKEVAELFREVLDDRGYNAFKTYVRQFDAHEIPFDGPKGIVERVERLLKHSPDRGRDNGELLDKFVRIILQNA